MVTVQVVPDAESQPLQPLKMARRSGVTSRVTTVPKVYETAQVAPQLIWLALSGLEVEVTVPFPLPAPAFATPRTAVTVKLFALVAVPAAVVTLIGPLFAVAGTVARIEVAEVTAKVAPTPLNVTDVAPVKFAPLIVTTVPTGPLAGEKLAIVGGFTTVNELALVAVPSGVVTLSGPVVAPAGTVAWIAVSEVTAKLALTPSKVTDVAPLKLAPLIVTPVPTGPLPGAKLAIVGGCSTANALALV